jgi:hypothetical protein
MAVIGHGDIAGARYFMSLGADPYHYDVSMHILLLRVLLHHNL